MGEAARLFRTRGYHGTSMSDIAEVMNLNKGTLYHYFPSKTAILDAIYLEALVRLDRNVDAVPDGLPPDEQLISYVRAIMRTISSAPDFIAVYFQERPWLDSSLSQAQAESIRKKETEFTDRIAGVLRAGMRKGVFRHVDERLLSIHLLSMISSLYRWRLVEDIGSGDMVAHSIISYLYDGILVRPR